MPAIALYHQYARRAYVSLIGASVLCVGLYAAFLVGALAHAAGESAAAAEIKKLTTNIGTLEARYLAETKALSPERARLLGFVAPQTQWVVYVAQEGLTLR